jgi:hypothetical protein
VAKIGASVGIRNGKWCYNVPSDQQVVQKLLNRISVGNGGCEGKSDDWTPAVWNHQCAPDLLEAIRRFQKVNRFRLDYDSDGHVDPGEGTIQLMTRLAEGGVIGLPGGAGSKLSESDRRPNVSWTAIIVDRANGVGIRAVSPQSTHRNFGDPVPFDRRPPRNQGFDAVGLVRHREPCGTARGHYLDIDRSRSGI